MIYVTTGTVKFPFKRLVEASLEIFSDSNEQLVIQSGSYKPRVKKKHTKIFDYLTFDENLKLYKTADMVISACGQSSAYLLIQNANKVPIFFPRQKKYGEHTDDQQLLLADFLKKNNLADVAKNSMDLTKLVKKRPLNKFKFKDSPPTKLIQHLDKITRGEI